MCVSKNSRRAHLDGDFLVHEPSGIHYLQIDEVIRGVSEAALASPKSVKSQAGWRKVPLHPALVEAGFIAYLEDERAAGAITPFARSRRALRGANGRVKHSHKVTDWGSEVLSELRVAGAITKERVTFFHSMRHS